MPYQNRIGSTIKCSVEGEAYYAYIPKPLPPDPPLGLTTIYPLLEQANIALGRLDGLSLTLPEPSLLLYMYIRKEAVLSSQIEGTQSSLSDLLMFENDAVPGVPIDDVTEVSNYVAAMNHGLKRLDEGFPLSLRLIREIHEILLLKGRGQHKQPGEFRRSQNWIGGSRPGTARFVPPPPDRLMECLDAFEKFLHDEKNHSMPTLIKAALAHVQFETIHPFLDGNGRLGRLLITFILCTEKVLTLPLLYLSLYFRANRQSYYDHLQLVRETGDWEEWLSFFLKGVLQTAEQATETAKNILQLFEQDHVKMTSADKVSASLLRVYQYFKQAPITDTKKIMQRCDMTRPTALKALETLKEIGIIQEITGKKSHRVYVYQTYLDLLNRGVEPNLG